MPSFPISRGRAETVVDEEDAWRFKEFHYYLKNVPRVDGTVRRYALRHVTQVSPDGLPVRYKTGRIKKTRLRLHVEILEAKLGRAIRRGCMTDHADGDGLHNRRSNLREATNGQNKANQRKQTGLTSKYKGVSWFHPTQQWQAQTKKDWNVIPLGLFATEVEAAQAYDVAARIIWPNFFRLNFPDQPQPAHIVKRVKRALAKHGIRVSGALPPV